MKLGFIGVGHLASSIIDGLLRNPSAGSYSFVLTDLSGEKLSPYLDNPRVTPADNALSAARQSEIVFLAVRPADIEDTLGQLKALTQSELESKLFVSPAAAVSTSFIRKHLGSGAKVVRCMPNTASRVGLGATAVCASENVPESELLKAVSLFDAVGLTKIIAEPDMEKIIAVNGSSPVYVYMLMQAMLDWAGENGVQGDDMAGFIAQIVEGAAVMAKQSGKPIAELIDAVCVPGGTSIEAFNALNQSGFAESIAKAMDACTKRAMDMKK